MKKKSNPMATYKAVMRPDLDLCLFHIVASCIIDQH